MAGETPANQSGENAIFKVRGKELLTCLLAHMLWDSTRPTETKTLRDFRQLVRTPEKQMPQLLADTRKLLADAWPQEPQEPQGPQE